MFDVTQITYIINSLIALDLQPVLLVILALLALVVIQAIALVRARLKILKLQAEVRRLRGNPIKRAFVRFLRSILGRLDAEPEPKTRRQPRREREPRQRQRKQAKAKSTFTGFDDFFGDEQ